MSGTQGTRRGVTRQSDHSDLPRGNRECGAEDVSPDVRAFVHAFLFHERA
jgi:hypothetical protein